MKILLLDSVPGRAPVVQKEGSRLFMALGELGHEATLVGPGFSRFLSLIPRLARGFDACVLCDNYPELWRWSAFERIEIPKAFWAIDTHLKRFEFVPRKDFQLVLFNNFSDIDRFMSQKDWEPVTSAFFPYAIDPTFPADLEGASHFRLDSVPECRDLVFCGGMTQQRARMIADFEGISSRQVVHLEGYGQQYIDNILSGRINLNFPIANDFNGKVLEILSLRKMLLTRANINTEAVLPRCLGIYFDTLEELAERVNVLLQDEAERARISQIAYAHVLKRHTYLHRARQLVELLRGLV